MLGDDFDARMLAMTEEPKQVKARVITMTQRLRPLFKAAAVVAIILTLSNAFQMSFDNNGPVIGSGATNYNRIQQMHSVARADSAVLDTMPQSNVQPSEVCTTPIMKR